MPKILGQFVLFLRIFSFLFLGTDPCINAAYLQRSEISPGDHVEENTEASNASTYSAATTRSCYLASTRFSGGAEL